MSESNAHRVREKRDTGKNLAKTIKLPGYLHMLITLLGEIYIILPHNVFFRLGEFNKSLGII